MFREFSLLLILVLIFCSGCFESSDCESQNTNRLRVQFLTKDSLKADPVAFIVRAENNDSLLYDGSSEVSSYTLPLDPASESAAFLFDAERIEFSYRKRSYLDGLNCDTELEYDQLEIVSTTFDSTAVIRTDLNLEVTTNVEIYR